MILSSHLPQIFSLHTHTFQDLPLLKLQFIVLIWVFLKAKKKKHWLSVKLHAKVLKQKLKTQPQ